MPNTLRTAGLAVLAAGVPASIAEVLESNIERVEHSYSVTARRNRLAIGEEIHA